MTMDVSSGFPITDGPLNFGTNNTNYTIEALGGHGTSSFTWQYFSHTSSYVSREETEKVIEVNSNSTFNETLNLSCLIDPAKSITHSLVALDGETLPTWVTLDSVEDIIRGDAPLLYQNTTYSFYVNSSWTDSPAGSSQKLIKININQTYVPPVNNQTDESKTTLAATSSSKAAVTSSQTSTGMGVGIALITNVMTGSPPMSVWAILQQLQMVIILVMIDSFTPEDIDYYLEGVSFALFNFDFIPIKSLPFVDVPTDWMDFAQPLEKLEIVGLESRSTLVNNVSFLATLFSIMTIHFILKCSSC